MNSEFVDLKKSQIDSFILLFQETGAVANKKSLAIL